MLYSSGFSAVDFSSHPSKAMVPILKPVEVLCKDVEQGSQNLVG
jgi:hypothetical protein